MPERCSMRNLQKPVNDLEFEHKAQERPGNDFGHHRDRVRVDEIVLCVIVESFASHPRSFVSLANDTQERIVNRRGRPRALLVATKDQTGNSRRGHLVSTVSLNQRAKFGHCGAIRANPFGRLVKSLRDDAGLKKATPRILGKNMTPLAYLLCG